MLFPLSYFSSIIITYLASDLNLFLTLSHEFSIISYSKLGDLMKIVASKNNLFNMDEFLSSNHSRDYVHGLFVNIVKTKDDELLIFDFVDDNFKDLLSMEEKSLQELYPKSIVFLEQFLNQVQSYEIKKDLYLNLLLNFNVIDPQEIENYIANLLVILRQYPDFSFHLCSRHQPLLTHLKNYDLNYPLGFIVSSGNYIDVDFYIFSIVYLNAKILLEQHERNKKLMIHLESWDDLDFVDNFFEEAKELPSSLVNQVHVIGTYPEIIYRSLEK